MRAASVILRLGLKEIMSLVRDPVLSLLVVYAMTLAIYSVATGVRIEVRNAAVAVVDDDRSILSRRLQDALLPPQFQPPVDIAADEADAAMDSGRFTFVLVVPPDFEADLLARRQPELQLLVDATAMTLAGGGTGYIEAILRAEIADFLGGPAAEDASLAIRFLFNPNLQSEWFHGVMQLLNMITILAIILSGAAVIREREQGTIEHLLVMPVTPAEIMLAKIWANGLVILLASLVSIHLVLRGALGVPVAGSVTLFAFGAAIYLFAICSLGIALSTLARTMPQFGLLSIPVFVVLNLLSGTMTPLEAMPRFLELTMQATPAAHFVRFAQAVLHRGADLGQVWPDLALTALIGAAYFAFGLARFRRAMAQAQ